LAYPHLAVVTDPRDPHRRCHPLELQERNVSGGIGRNDFRAHHLTADAFNRDFVHAVDDMRGRHHPAASGRQETRADLVEAGEPACADVAALAAHDDDGRVDLAEDVVKALRVRYW